MSKTKNPFGEGTYTILKDIPRHLFVPAGYQAEAYKDRPLPIGYGQTISQPYIVALMTHALQVQAGDTVLEIGTGSGYQAAVLAQLGVAVYSVELIPELAQAAQQRLDELGYHVQVKVGDGYAGWPEHAPYDGIIVTAAPEQTPPLLIQQLKVGKHLIIPVGPAGGYQVLWKITRSSESTVTQCELGGVAFVPLLRKQEVP
jgi:protein-L-isoaspartate(D-aspartate) O-methyltransferase